MVAIGMGQSVVFAIIPMLGRELALDEIVLRLPWLGIEWQPRELAITSLSALTALIFSLVAPFWGRRSDLWGRKRVMMIGLVGYAIGTVLFNAVAWLGLREALLGGALFAALMVTRVIHASIMSATQPATSAYVADNTTADSRTAGLGKLQAANQIGVMIGPALAWFAVINYLAPMYLQAALTLIIALLVYRLLPESAGQVRRRSSTRLRVGDPRFVRYVLIGFVLFTMLGMVQQTLGFYFQDRLQLDGITAAQRFSVAMMVSSGAMLFAQLVVVQRFAWSPIALLRSGIPLVMAGYFYLAIADDLGSLYRAMALFGLGMGLASPGYSASATLVVTAQEQGALAGILGSAAGMGFLGGPLIGAFIYRFNPSLPYWTAGAVLLPLSFYVWRLRPVTGARVSDG
jgi:MFS family permease